MIEMPSYVVIERDKFMKVHHFTPHSHIVGLGKMSVDISNAVGKAHGSTFRLVAQSTNNKKSMFMLEIAKREDIVAEMKKGISSDILDNRNLVDDGSSQKLSRDDITAFRAQGMSEQDIILELIGNSNSFNEKTDFSQEKYIKKKHKKYSQFVTIRRPSIRLLSHIFYTLDPLKIINLRIDSLSQMLSYADVKAGDTYLLYESGCQGLVSAAILDRLHGRGNLIQVHNGNTPQRQAVDAMNFTSDQLACLKVLDLTFWDRVVNPPQKTSCYKCTLKDGEPGSTTSNGDVLPVGEEIPDQMETHVAGTPLEPCRKRMGDEAGQEGPSKKRKRQPFHVSKEECRVAVELLQSGNHSGLIIAAKEHPLPFIKMLLDFIAPSQPFVVFCTYSEPLVECFAFLKDTGKVVNVRLTETWLRNYQVLPERTHPEVNMSGGGGYMLHGIKVK